MGTSVPCYKITADSWVHLKPPSSCITCDDPHTTHPHITSTRSGQQFFLQDGTPSHPPLLFRLATDTHEAPYLSALRSFKTRTAYANCSGDHLVGWANSSLRWPHDLQELHLPPQLRRRGVVREDPPSAALWGGEGGDVPAVGVGGDAASQGVAHEATEDMTGDTTQQPATAPASVLAAAEHQVEAREHVPEMLRALQSMPWRRVDVCFREASVPMLAHNHIQAMCLLMLCCVGSLIYPYVHYRTPPQPINAPSCTIIPNCHHIHHHVPFTATTYTPPYSLHR